MAPTTNPAIDPLMGAQFYCTYVLEYLIKVCHKSMTWAGVKLQIVVSPAL